MASAWIEQVFKSKIAKRGGTVRRKKSAIAKYASLEEFKKVCKERGYHIFEHGDQWVVLCDSHLKLVK